MNKEEDFWIRTFSGLKFNPFNPKPDQVLLIDIAHHLSNICRFTGACNKFYSIAQHSVMVSVYTSKENALWGLLHDAAEAYINDLSRPVKRHPGLFAYRYCEELILKCISEKFNLSLPIPEEVKNIDDRLLITEASSLGINTDGFGICQSPIPTKIIPVTPETAERAFIEWYRIILESIHAD